MIFFIISGFADEIMKRSADAEDMGTPTVSMLYSKASVVNSLMGKIATRCKIQPNPTPREPAGRSVDALRAELKAIKNYT